jgi:transposase
MLGRGAKDKEHAMSQTFNAAVSVVGIDIGKNSFHIVGHDKRGAIVLRQKWSRGQVEARFDSALPGRHGSLRRRASSQPQAQ